MITNGFGAKTRFTAAPVPLSDTLDGVTVAAGVPPVPVPATFSVPVEEVAVVGVKRMITVQLAPAFSVAVHVPPAPAGRANGAARPVYDIVNVWLPVLVTVTVRGVLELPTDQLPNASEPGLTVAV